MEILLDMLARIDLQMVIAGLSGVFIGLLFGWVNWGRYEGMFEQASAGLRQANTRAHQAEADSRRALEARDVAEQSRDTLAAELAECGEQLRADHDTLSSEKQTMATEIGNLRARLTADHEEWEAKLNARQEAVNAANTLAEQLQVERDTLTIRVTALEEEIEGLKARSTTPFPTPAARPSGTLSLSRAIDPSTGATRDDPVLGLLYSEAPAQCDDLTQIKGIAAVLQGKLNDLGIYTFQQIAGWSEEQVKEVSQRLHFKERIQHGHWVEQARELHRAKHGDGE